MAGMKDVQQFVEDVQSEMKRVTWPDREQLRNATAVILVFCIIIAIIIGLILAGTAAWLAYETKSLLIGESANPEVIRGVRKMAGSHGSIQHVNEILTLHMGPDFILLNLSVDFDNEASAGEVEKTIARLDQDIKQAHPRIKRIFIEAEDRRQRAEDR